MPASALRLRPSWSSRFARAAASLTTAALSPFEPKADPENPYTLHAELQQTMNDLVGIIRTGEEMQQALDRIEEITVRFRNIESDGVELGRQLRHIAADRGRTHEFLLRVSMIASLRRAEHLG